jgi:hypothetical protein
MGCRVQPDLASGQLRDADLGPATTSDRRPGMRQADPDKARRGGPRDGAGGSLLAAQPFLRGMPSAQLRELTAVL